MGYDRKNKKIRTQVSGCVQNVSNVVNHPFSSRQGAQRGAHIITTIGKS